VNQNWKSDITPIVAEDAAEAQKIEKVRRLNYWRVFAVLLVFVEFLMCSSNVSDPETFLRMRTVAIVTAYVLWMVMPTIVFANDWLTWSGNPQ
jgi:hypothetical protein